MIKVRQILTLLLSAYLLILMVFPCSDAHTRHNIPAKAHIEQGAKGHHHNDLDICTPFCVCGSCVAAVVIHPALEVALFAPTDTFLQEPDFYQLLQSFFKGSIWQPPQLL